MSQEHWSSPNGCHPDCPVCAERADLLTGLSESDLAFHESLSAILSCEDGVLDPDDADSLALVIVNELPAAYSEGPNLLKALRTLMADLSDVGDDRDGETGEEYSACIQAREAITKATGAQS